MRGSRAMIKRLPTQELSHTQHQTGMARTSSVTCGQCSRRNPRGCRCRVVAVVVVGGGSCGSSSSTYHFRPQVDFVRAERSAFVWTDDDVERIHQHGARVNFLPDASHWVHIDNPEGQPAC